MFSSSRFLPLALLGLVAATLPVQAQNRVPDVLKSPDVLLSTRSDGTGATISPYLTGSQFTFFDTPIKARYNDPKLLSTWQEANVSMLRYPGGTWADHYVWDHPENSYFVSKSINANTIIKPDEFMQMCRQIGAEPIFQVNAVTKGQSIYNRTNPTKIEDIRQGAQWAAGWVRQANIENKWNVKYWEIGNELWIMLRPEENATIVAEYSKAMKAVDPSIKIIACGLSSDVGPFKIDWLDFKDDPTWKMRMANTNNARDWNTALFNIAKGHFDYVAPHPYISAKETQDAREIYLQTTAKVWEQEGMKEQYELLDTLNRQAGTSARLAVTEWATNFNLSVPGSSGKGKFPLYYYSLGNGINMAHYLGQIIASGKSDIAVMHELADAQTLWYWPKNALSEKPLSHPAFLGVKLWGTHLGNRRLTSDVAAQPKFAIGGKEYPATFTFASEDANNVYLVAINLDPDAPHKIQWKHGGAAATPAAKFTLLAGASIDTDNWAYWNQETAEVRLKQSDLTADSNNAYTFELPPHSMAGLTIPKGP